MMVSAGRLNLKYLLTILAPVANGAFVDQNTDV